MDLFRIIVAKNRPTVLYLLYIGFLFKQLFKNILEKITSLKFTLGKKNF